MKFAEILQKLMREHDMSNYKLAKEIGCSQSTVANWLSETVFPQKRAQKQLCEVFGVSNDYLLGLTPEQQLEDAEAEFAEVSAELDGDPDNFDLQCRYDALKSQIDDLKLSIGIKGAKKDPSVMTDEEVDKEMYEILSEIKSDPAVHALLKSAKGSSHENLLAAAKMLDFYKNGDTNAD